MKKTNITETNGGTRVDSSCIIWTGPEIECLDICTGDKLNDAVFALAEKVCSSIVGVDLSTLSIQCLADQYLITLPTDKSVLNILQVLTTNQCHIKDLIDAVDDKIVNIDVNLDLNLSCLGTTDGFGNPIAKTQLELDQILIDAVCSLRTRMSSVEGRLTTAEDEIDALQTQVDAIDTDPEVTTCIGASKPLSEAIVEIAADYCTYKTKVGTIAQITTALAMVYDDLNAEFAATPGWITPVTSEAQSISNLWIAFSNYANRIKVIEQTCCAPTCDKILLGAIPTFDYTQHTVTLLFSSGAGTYIPDGFIDAGSEIVLTDSAGTKTAIYNTIATPITVDSETNPIYLGLMLSGILEVSVKTNFVLRDRITNAIILTCAGCYSFNIAYGSQCCEIKNLTGGPITINYTIPYSSD